MENETLETLCAVGGIIWLLTFGWILWLVYVIVGICFLITIIGIPFALRFWNLAGYSLFPFGQSLGFEIEVGIPLITPILDILWFFCIGWAMAMHHLTWAVFLGITIIGLPPAWQHVKLACVSLLPTLITLED